LARDYGLAAAWRAVIFLLIEECRVVGRRARRFRVFDDRTFYVSAFVVRAFVVVGFAVRFVADFVAAATFIPRLTVTDSMHQTATKFHHIKHVLH
jgi:hypothetical protein